MKRLVISPKYLDLLSEALKNSTECDRSIDDFGDFINDLKWEMKINHPEIIEKLISEEINILRNLGPRSPNVRGDGSLKS